MRERARTTGGLSLRWETVGAAGGLGLWVVDDGDALLDQMTQEEFERTDERMPYFGVVWASAESLAACVLAGPSLDGARVLDLGCGLGLCGLAAGHRGARVTFFDWEPLALEIVAASVRDQSPPLPYSCDLEVGDWRDPPRLGTFDFILGADVLYERRNAPAVAGFLARHLDARGEAWIADPGRPQAEPFAGLARGAGLDLLSAELLPSQGHGEDITLLRFWATDLTMRPRGDDRAT